MYATCSYGKQYEELLETAGHLGDMWYAMVKFYDTRFAQSELEVYINFEKNYRTYRRAWGGSNTKTKEEAPSAVAEATVEVASTTTAATTTTTTPASSSSTTTTTTAQEQQEQQLQQEP